MEQPKFQLSKFHCPHCDAYSHQQWDIPHIFIDIHIQEFGSIKDYYFCQCACCDQYSIWYQEKMIYPNKSLIILPHEDMPQELKKDFIEARDIFNVSPRGSAALLRLVLQKLMLILGETGENINEDIKSLVSKGLPTKIQQALDYCRVIGNNAVHPSQINIDDTPEIAQVLFKMINFIIEEMITKPKELDELYNLLPESARTAIEKRDKL